MNKYYHLFLFILAINSVLAQTDTTSRKIAKNNIQFAFGLAHSRMIDEGLTESKLLMRGTNSKFLLGYGRETEDAIFNFLITASFGKLTSKSGNLSSDFYSLEPSIEYVRKIKTYSIWDKQGKFFAGLHLSSINYALYDLEIFDNIDVISFHGLHLNITTHIDLDEKHQLRVTYLMPLAGYTNHALWSGGASDLNYDDRDNFITLLTTHGKFSAFELFNIAQWKVDVKKKIGKNTDFIVRYKFFYMHNKVEAPLRFYSNELLLGLKFGF